MKRLTLLLILAATLLAAAPSHAQADQPILSKSRLSAGVLADYCGFQKAGDQRLPEFTKSWEFGLAGAYTLVAPAPGTSGPILSLAASSAYDVDNKWFRHRIGIRLILFKGGSY